MAPRAAIRAVIPGPAAGGWFPITASRAALLASRAVLLASRAVLLASRAALLASRAALLPSRAALLASRTVQLPSRAALPASRAALEASRTARPAIPSPVDLSRYHRQMLLPGFGEDAQRRLAAAHAVIVGVGALGCVSADLLARAGVGRLTLIDRDIVETTNLQRQTLFDERDAAGAMPKAEAARRRLAAVNSAITIDARVADLSPVSARALLDDALGPPGGGGPPAVLLDGTDNFATRYLLNDLAVARGLPLVYAGVVGTAAVAMSVLPAGGRGAAPPGPCLRCVFPDPPPPGSTPTCDTAGVLGPAATIVAAYQAAEAMKILLGRSDLVLRSLLSFDPWHGRRTRLDLSAARDPACPCCGLGRFDFLDAEPDAPAVSLCGRGAVQVAPPAPTAIDLDALAARLAPLGSFRRTGFLVIGELAAERGDGGGPIGLAVFADGRAQIRGTASPERARALYARFVGA